MTRQLWLVSVFEEAPPQFYLLDLDASSRSTLALSSKCNWRQAPGTTSLCPTQRPSTLTIKRPRPSTPASWRRWTPYWEKSFGNPHSSDHVIGWQADKAVREAASSIAALIGADSDEIIFTSGATEANNLALLGLARRAPAGRRRILVSAIEHKCVLAAARALSAREGFTVETVPVDDEGFVDLDALERCLDQSVLVLSVMAVNNEVGTIQDIPRVAEMLAPHDILLHCDAAQAPCAIDMSNLAAHADLVSLSGHKMYGPPGIGTLYIRRDLQERIEPLIYGGGQQEGLRSGTVPMPLCVGMGAAAEFVVGREALKNAHELLDSGMHSLGTCNTGMRSLPSTAPLATAAIRAMPMSDLTASTRRIFLVGCSLGSLRPPAPPARPAYPSHRTCFAPWASPRLRAMLPSASASGGLPPTTISKRLRT